MYEIFQLKIESSEFSTHTHTHCDSLAIDTSHRQVIEVREKVFFQTRQIQAAKIVEKNRKLYKSEWTPLMHRHMSKGFY